MGSLQSLDWNGGLERWTGMVETSQQAHSQLIVTIDDHRLMGQADKTSELDACTI